MTKPAPGISSNAQSFNWLVNRFAEGTAGVIAAIAVSADGLLIAIGGTLLLTPGFVTDVFGLLFLIPPTRAVVRRLMRGYVTRRFVIVGAPGSSATPPPSRREYDYESTAEEIDGDDPRLTK